jgi:hypothetical protein
MLTAWEQQQQRDKLNGIESYWPRCKGRVSTAAEAGSSRLFGRAGKGLRRQCHYPAFEHGSLLTLWHVARC